MKQKLDRNNDGRVGPRELEHAKQVKENASKGKKGKQIRQGRRRG
jgi:hypothetical protein